MQVQILRDFKYKGIFYLVDDVYSVETVQGEYFCEQGWARDLSGNVKTRSTKPVETVLNIKSSILGGK